MSKESRPNPQPNTEIGKKSKTLPPTKTPPKQTPPPKK